MTAIAAPPTHRVITPAAGAAGVTPRRRHGIDGRPVPALRGRLHEAAIGPWLLIGARWIAATPSPDRAAVAAFVVTTAAMFTASAAYHCWTEASPRQVVARRWDHAMIHVAIAGTHTAVWPFVAPPAVAACALGGVWLVAAVGIVHAHRHVGRELTAQVDTHFVISAAGGATVLPWLVAGAPLASTILIVAGGIAYVIGALVLARRALDLAPGVFGYHESWHLFVVVGVALHAAGIAVLTA